MGPDRDSEAAGRQVPPGPGHQDQGRLHAAHDRGHLEASRGHHKPDFAPYLINASLGVNSPLVYLQGIKSYAFLTSSPFPNLSSFPSL